MGATGTLGHGDVGHGDVVELVVRPRRRRRAVLVLVVAAAVAAAVGAVVVVLVVWHGTATDPARGGYPQRIGFDRPSDPLPERPGALAATMYDNDFGSGRALGVTSGGDLWELPDGETALSPSGLRLLVRPWDASRRAFVEDLGGGDRFVLPDELWSGRPGGAAGVHWSPDETTLLASDGPPGRPRQVRAVTVDITTGAVSRLGDGVAAGYRSPSEVVTVAITDGVVATTTDLTTGAAEDLDLQLDSPWRGDPRSPGVASVSPDGSTLLLVEVRDGRSGETTIRLFSLADGSELPPRTVRDWDGCAPGWVGVDPVLPTSSVVHGSSRAASAVLLGEHERRPLVAVHPRLQSSCLQLTAAALETGPRWSLFGTSTALWTWYWVPALVVAVLTVLAVLLLVAVVHRRRPRPTAPR